MVGRGTGLEDERRDDLMSLYEDGFTGDQASSAT